MRHNMGVLLATSILLTGCSAGEQHSDAASPTTGPNPTVIDSAASSPERLTEIPDRYRNAMQQYIGRYGCSEDNVELRLEDITPEEGEFDPGVVVTMYTSGNTITIDPDLEVLSVLGVGEYVAMFHEMTHACNSKVRKLATPLEYSNTADGSTVKIEAIEGFIMIADPSTVQGGNRNNRVTLIEEGVAEWLAADFPEYSPTASSDGYQALLAHTEWLMGRAGLTRDEVSELNQASDLEGFIGRIFAKEPAEVTTNDIFAVYASYQQVYNGLPQTALS